MNIHAKKKLNNGVSIPLFGLGTWRAADATAMLATRHALQIGYRHIDTASFYQNEKEIGEGIQKSGVPRSDIFVATKLWNDEHDHVEAALNDSLDRLGLEYVDLYLMHYPVRDVRLETWEQMEALYNEGKCKAIGVSNFTVRHLKELLKHCSVVPAVNQVEFSVFLYQKELLAFCKENGIALEAYSPLTRGHKFTDTNLVRIAGKYDKTPAQILIKWCLQHDVVVIPKSVSEKRIEENADVFDFEISDEDMAFLDTLNEDFRVCWDPTNEP